MIEHPLGMGPVLAFVDSGDQGSRYAEALSDHSSIMPFRNHFPDYRNVAFGKLRAWVSRPYAMSSVKMAIRHVFLGCRPSEVVGSAIPANSIIVRNLVSGSRRWRKKCGGYKPVDKEVLKVARNTDFLSKVAVWFDVCLPRALSSCVPHKPIIRDFVIRVRNDLPYFHSRHPKIGVSPILCLFAGGVQW